VVNKTAVAVIPNSAQKTLSWLQNLQPQAHSPTHFFKDLRPYRSLEFRGVKVRKFFIPHLVYRPVEKDFIPVIDKSIDLTRAC